MPRAAMMTRAAGCRRADTRDVVETRSAAPSSSGGGKDVMRVTRMPMFDVDARSHAASARAAPTPR